MKNKEEVIQNITNELDKLHSRVNYLEDLVKTLQRKLRELSFKVASPPRFKKGDKVGDYIVTDQIWCEQKIGLLEGIHEWHYTVIVEDNLLKWLTENELIQIAKNEMDKRK